MLSLTLFGAVLVPVNAATAAVECNVDYVPQPTKVVVLAVTVWVLRECPFSAPLAKLSPKERCTSAARVSSSP